MSSPKSQLGFTLIELMVTIAIVAILLTLGVPSMRDLLERNAVSGHINGFVGSVNLSRSEAMKRGIPVVMCRSNDPDTAATPTCLGAGSNWEGGWIVFADRNADSQMTANTSDVLLRVQGRITDSGGITQSTSDKLVFRPNGLMSLGESVMTFEARSASVSQRRRVCLSLSGRTRLIDDSVTTCD
jgi:type IV fimbrial biogenesis protein FimT